MENVLTTIYGALAFGSLMASIRQDDQQGQRLGLVMLMSWLISVFSLTELGPDWAPMLFGPVDAILALIVAVDFSRYGYDRAGWVFCLFIAEMLTYVIFGGRGDFGCPGMYAVLNLIFLAQVFAGGGVNVAGCFRDWILGRDHRARVPGRRR